MMHILWYLLDLTLGMGINHPEDEFDVIADTVAEAKHVPTALDIGFREEDIFYYKHFFLFLLMVIVFFKIIN